MATTWKTGADAGCPFCSGLLSDLSVGDEIHILSGVHAGATARVLQRYPDWSIPGEVLLQIHGDPYQMRFSRFREIAQRLPGFDRPEWFPPVPLRDAADLHEEILKFCATLGEEEQTAVDWRSFYAVIGVIWRLRLPVDPDELLAILRAHGVAEAYQARLGEVYSHGRDVLVFNCGRKPVKKKRSSLNRWRI